MRPTLQDALSEARELAAEELPRLLGDLEEIRATAQSRLLAPPAQAVPDEWLDVKQAAKLLRMSESTGFMRSFQCFYCGQLCFMSLVRLCEFGRRPIRLEPDVIRPLPFHFLSPFLSDPPDVCRLRACLPKECGESGTPRGRVCTFGDSETLLGGAFRLLLVRSRGADRVQAAFRFLGERQPDRRSAFVTLP